MIGRALHGEVERDFHIELLAGGDEVAEIRKRAERKGSRRWFDPTRKIGLERATAGADSLLDQREYTTHEIEPLLRENRHLGRRVRAE